MNKSELLDTLREERARWEGLLAEIDEAEMTQAGVVGDWSVKDIVAHVTWAERETVGMLRARALVGSELWYLSQDERNAAVFEENRHRSLEEIRREAEEVFQHLLAEVEALTEKDLADPQGFQGWPAEWIPWRVIAGNSYLHYRDHIEDIRAWRENPA